MSFSCTYNGNYSVRMGLRLSNYHFLSQLNHKEKGNCKVKNKKIKKIIIAVVLVCIALVLFFACRGGKGTAGQYTEVQAQVKDMSSYLEFTGNVEAANNANVYADAAAKVLELKAEEGDEVKAGDVIAVLDSSDIEYNIQLKEAALKATNTSNYYNIKDTQNALEQYQETMDSGLNNTLVSAQKALISAQQQYQDAVDTYNQAKSDYENNKNQSVVSARQQLQAQQAAYDNSSKQHDEGFISDEAFESSQVSLASAQESLRLAKEQAQKQIEDYYDAVTQAEQALANAERDYEASLLSTDQTGENYQNNVEKAQAQASTETSELELAHLRESLEDYVIYAPIGGTITTMNLKEGNYTTTGNTVAAEIQDFSTMQVAVKIDEQNIGGVHIGDPVSVYINALDKTYDGKVSDISKTAVKSNNAVYVEATVEFEADDDVRSGFSAEVKLVKASAENAICIPLDAVNYDTDNTAYVNVKGADGEMEKRSVKLGLSDTSMVQITEGLSEGETVLQEVKLNTMYGYGMQMDMQDNSQGGPGGSAPDGAQ